LDTVIYGAAFCERKPIGYAWWMNPLPVPPAAAPADAILPGLTPPATTSPTPPPRMLTADDLGTPPRSRFLPLLLFLATCFFTYAAGTYHWQATFFGMQGDDWNLQHTLDLLTKNWRDGLIYMGCVMTVLIFHEMGHFLMTVRYRVPASYPIFLPLPMMHTGTMGAVIGMEGSRANRKQLFDIGLAGPLAGLVPTVILVWIGVRVAVPEALQVREQIFGSPLLLQWMFEALRPELQGPIDENPFLMAGWVGMFITGLNMMPVSQLDGGHTIYALFLQRGHFIARAFLLAAMAFVVIAGQYGWTIMLVIITLIGVDHPPTSDDNVPLGPVRTIVGTLSLAIPIFCFTPYPLYVR
jgi:Zn-dependent protease